MTHRNPMITYRRLQRSEQERFAEVDRSERITQAYRQHGRELELVAVDWHARPWSLPAILREWAPFLQDDCVLWGAFDGDALIGFCGYRPNVAPGTGQFALLHVSNQYRGRGIGRRLAEALFAYAHAQGTTALYVTATPTRNTVDFYLGLGFEPTDDPLPALLELEPDDIHMRMTIRAD